MSGYGIPEDYDAGKFAERLIKRFKNEIALFRLKRIAFAELQINGENANVLCIYREDRRGNITAFEPIARLLTEDEIKNLRNFDGGGGFHVEER